jgi:uncharacterized protein (UPF0276 family)
MLEPSVGLAFSSYVPTLLKQFPSLVDFVEVPYELLKFDSETLESLGGFPVVLHCASLSVAGCDPVADQTLEDVCQWIKSTKTPWLGEHLSFISANLPRECSFGTEYAPGEPYNIGYTVSPPMNSESVETVVDAVNRIQARIEKPLLLENPPIYFTAPGSKMTQGEFVSKICSRCSVGILLDLSHFVITSRYFRVDPMEALLTFPLERVVEVHVSGIDEENGMHWDNHASEAPEIVISLLTKLLSIAKVQAVTLEYNWSSVFPQKLLLKEIERVRRAIR